MSRKNLTQELDYVDLRDCTIDPTVVGVIPSTIMERYNILALTRQGRKLTIAMDDITNVFALDDVRLATGYDLEPVRARDEQIKEFRASAGIGPILKIETESILAEAADQIRSIDEKKQALAEDDEKEKLNTDQAPIIRMVNVLIQNAIREDMDWIHVEPGRVDVTVYFRKNGQERQEMMQLPKFAYAPIISRLKIMCEANFAERRIPQSGFIHIRHEKKDYDLVCEFVPGVHGEIFQARFERNDYSLSLDDLAITPTNRKKLIQIRDSKNGVIFCAAPSQRLAGDLLYATIRKVVTVERPGILLEPRHTGFEFRGMTKSYINRKAGYNLDVAMRTASKLDFDVIAVNGVEFAVVEKIFHLEEKLILVAIVAENFDHLTRRLTQEFEIRPGLVNLRTKAALFYDGKVAKVVFDLAGR